MIIKTELKKLLSHKEIYAAWAMAGIIMIIQFVIEIKEVGWTVWDKIISNESGIIPYVVTMLIAVGLCGIFSYEREEGMSGILRVCKQGQRKTLLSKLVACIVYVVIIEMAILFAQVIMYGAAYGFGGLSFPTERFHTVPDSMPVGVQLILMIMYSSLGSFAFGGMVMLFSTVLKPAHAAALSGGIFIGVELLHRQQTIAQLLKPISYFISDFSFNNIINTSGFVGETWNQLIHLFIYPLIFMCVIFAAAAAAYYKTRYRA